MPSAASTSSVTARGSLAEGSLEVAFVDTRLVASPDTAIAITEVPTADLIRAVTLKATSSVHTQHSYVLVFLTYNPFF